MFKNRFLKKLSIGIVSLALVCPLTLGATQSVNAKASHTNTSQTTHYRKNNRLTPVTKIKNNISNDNKILNTKQAHYYLDIQKDLSKNEGVMKSLKLTRHTNVHYKRNGQSQTVYIPKKQMTAGYKNSLRQSKYLSNDFYGDISRDKKILRHHKSGRTASLAIKNLAWARRGVKASNKADYINDHSFKAVNSNRVVAPNNLSVYKSRPVRVALNKGIYVNLTKIESPESNNKVVKAVHLNQNTPVNAKYSSKGYILSNKKLLPSKKGYLWIY